MVNLDIYQKAMTEAPNDYWSYFGIVSSKLGLNDIPEALSVLKIALEVAENQNISDE